MVRIVVSCGLRCGAGQAIMWSAKERSGDVFHSWPDTRVWYRVGVRGGQRMGALRLSGGAAERCAWDVGGRWRGSGEIVCG